MTNTYAHEAYGRSPSLHSCSAVLIRPACARQALLFTPRDLPAALHGSWLRGHGRRSKSKSSIRGPSQNSRV